MVNMALFGKSHEKPDASMRFSPLPPSLHRPVCPLQRSQPLHRPQQHPPRRLRRRRRSAQLGGAAHSHQVPRGEVGAQTQLQGPRESCEKSGEMRKKRGDHGFES
jgi:hypothetical protein